MKWISIERHYIAFVDFISLFGYIPPSQCIGVNASEHVKLFAILSPVGPYYKNGFVPVKLFADTEHVRAWPGGVGNAKVSFHT
jgi:hypothetical protein